jgi:HD-GYP domain-containing protein (c-di-GMP phosphodiesterase class II)
MGTEEAIEELRRCSGTQFDPTVVTRLTEILDRKHSSPRVEKRV